MTWHAQRGETVLQGEEALIFADAIDEMCDSILDADSDEESFVFRGPSIFNRMTRTQQAASIESVTSALFQETSTCFPLTAWSESTLAAILSHLKGSLACEVDMELGCSIRTLINSRLEKKVTVGNEQWHDTQFWLEWFDLYEEEFLWDLDYENDNVVDLPPDVARLVGESLGVDQEYHTAIPPDLKNDEEELDACLDRVHRIIRRLN